MFWVQIGCTESPCLSTFVQPVRSFVEDTHAATAKLFTNTIMKYCPSRHQASPFSEKIDTAIVELFRDSYGEISCNIHLNPELFFQREQRFKNFICAVLPVRPA